jgi:Asp-tRNA(Asn)/Glu-tRNA(Gln) amidotransferase A subunit family amidase
VSALRRAGARLVGKTALHEFAFGATGVNDYEGTPRNPHDPARIAGGSSSGSAVAVAEGSAAAALGTDTGGSVRIPAALCGVVGVKPSYGRVSVDGVFPLAPSLDHVGVLAADIASAHAVLVALVPLGEAAAPRRVGVDRRALEESEPEVRAAVESALRALALELVDVALPDAAAIVSVTTAILYPEALRVHRESFEKAPERYGPGMRERLAHAKTISAEQERAAREEAQRYRARIAGLFDSVDVIAGPTVGFTAPTIEAARAPGMGDRLVRYTRLWNAVGLPAVSLPVPAAGLPVGLQLVAPDDARALAAAAAVEAALR